MHSAACAVGAGTRWSNTITTFDGSATFSTRRQPSGRNDRSIRQAVSTSTTATSPGETFGNPPARARIFSVMVMPMVASSHRRMPALSPVLVFCPGIARISLPFPAGFAA